MAVTAKFLADFSSFDAAVQKAEAELKSFDTTADKAGQAVVNMGASTDRTAPKVNNLQRAFGQFDNLLSTVGIHANQSVRALGEIGDAAGKTASELGAVATAGLALGTGLAAFSLTKAILEFTGLDKAIGNVVDRIHDFGKTAAEAGARQDSINLAIKRGADAQISYAEAVRFNDEWAKKHKQSALEAADALETWKSVQLDLAAAGEGWRGTLATVSGEVVEAIKWYLEAGVSQGTLAKAFGLTDAQVKAVSMSMAAHTEELKKLAAEDAKAAAAITAHWNDVGKIIDDVFGVEALNAATTWMDAINALGGSVESLTSTQLAALQEAMLAGIDALARSGQLTSEQSSQFANLAIQAGAALEALRPLVSTEQDLVKAQYEYALSIDKQLAAQAAANQATSEMTAISSSATSSVNALGAAAVSAGQGFFSMSEGLYAAIRAAQAADELNKIVPAWGKVNPGSIGNPFPAPPPLRTGTMGAASAMPYNVTVNVTQPLGTPDQIRRAVGDAMMQGLGGQGQRFPTKA